MPFFLTCLRCTPNIISKLFFTYPSLLFSDLSQKKINESAFKICQFLLLHLSPPNLRVYYSPSQRFSSLRVAVIVLLLLTAATIEID